MYLPNTYIGCVDMRNCKCPNCNAALSFSDDRDFGFCEYCGTKILLDDYRSTQRIVDEAKIRQVEAEKEIRLKELALQESRYNQQAKEKERNTKVRRILTYIWIGVSVILTTICVLLMSSGNDFGLGFIMLGYLDLPIIIGGAILLFKVIPNKEIERELLKNGGIKFPKSIEPFQEKDFETVRTVLSRAGFKNIDVVNMHDVVIGLFQKPNLVESISVAGERIQSGGKVYMPEAQIVITYHGR